MKMKMEMDMKMALAFVIGCGGNFGCDRFRFETYIMYEVKFVEFSGAVLPLTYIDVGKSTILSLQDFNLDRLVGQVIGLL